MAFSRWAVERASQLDDFERFLAAAARSERSRRGSAVQILHPFAVLLASQFQGFCRDLHSECVEHVSLALMPPGLRRLVLAQFAHGRRLDRGNPTPGNIGADFNRLGLSFWRGAIQDDARNEVRRRKLERLNRWRNAITHQDFDPMSLDPPRLTLGVVHSWRGACDGAARSFDRVMRRHLASLLGKVPW
jgi:hypothetical protein